MPLLFTYGSLKRGNSHSLSKHFGSLLKKSDAWLADWAMYDAGDGYPTITPELGKVVHGEIWDITTITLDGVHKFEGPKYSLELIEIPYGWNCLVYYYPKATGLRLIPSGMWPELSN